MKNHCEVCDDQFTPWTETVCERCQEASEKAKDEELTREREKVRALEESMSAHDKSRAKVLLQKHQALVKMSELREKVRKAREFIASLSPSWLPEAVRDQRREALKELGEE